MCSSRREIKDKTINNYKDNSTKTPMRTEGKNTLKANIFRKKRLNFVLDDTKVCIRKKRRKDISMKNYLIKQSLDLSRGMNLHIKEYE